MCPVLTVGIGVGTTGLRAVHLLVGGTDTVQHWPWPRGSMEANKEPCLSCSQRISSFCCSSSLAGSQSVFQDGSELSMVQASPPLSTLPVLASGLLRLQV